MSLLEVKVPPVGESVTEVTVAKLLVKNGDIVAIDQPILEFDSDKATLELPAPAAGKVNLLVKPGDDLKIGDTVCTIDTQVVITEETTPPPPANNLPDENTNHDNTKTKTVQNDGETYTKGHPSPSAQKIITEQGLQTEKIAGTGPKGRITKADALQAADNITKQQNVQITSNNNNVVDTDTSENNKNIRIEKITRLRKTISQRLVAVKNQTAMLTTFNEVDLHNINQLRDKYKDVFKEKHGIGLGYMSFFSKAAAQALMEFEAVNAYFKEDEAIIEYHNFVDISIAVSTPKGLVVPVMRNVETLNLKQIELAVKDLATKGRDGLLTIDDMTGGTFPITKGGVFGSLLSTPILNPPQSAILGMHSIQERPVAINGQIVIRPMMYVALSYDHRIIDGKEAVSFLVRIKQLLEDPIKLFLEL